MGNNDEKQKACPQNIASLPSDAKAFIIQRNTSRRMAVQALYALEINNSWQDIQIVWKKTKDGQPSNLDVVDITKKEQYDAIYPILLDEDETGFSHSVLRKAWSRARNLCLGIAENKQKIDELILDATKNWSLQRMDLVDKGILRLAIYEMLMATPLVSPGIAINEAVEIAKEFGKKDSGRFVNGVLDQIRKTATQPSFTVGGDSE